jgi:hypothetical protein
VVDLTDAELEDPEFGDEESVAPQEADPRSDEQSSRRG